MSEKAALEALKLPELKEIAKHLKLKKYETLKKQDLIAKIMDAAKAGELPKPADNRDTDAIAELAVEDEAPDPEPDEDADNGNSSGPDNGNDDNDDDDNDDDDDDDDDD